MPYDPSNIFAKILRGEIPAVKVYEDDKTLAFMDVMPQADGHTLVITKEPAENIFNLSPEGTAALIATAQKIARAVKKALDCDGITLTQFNGSAAGQSVFHVHFHVIPRLEGVPLRSHGGAMENPDRLKGFAEKIKAALC